MTKHIDPRTWERRDQFDFFMAFDQPFFNVCTEVRLTNLRTAARQSGSSIFLAFLHAALTAAHQVPAFRQRLDGDQVVEYDRVHTAVTVRSAHDTFRFCWLDYVPEFAPFQQAARERMEKAAQETGPLEPHGGRTDVIHVSSLPWIRFTSLMHPRKSGKSDSVPKLVFGRFFEQNGEVLLPLSIEVHHALADGIHIAHFLDSYQSILDHPQSY
ncbi:MAG TPA: chloramphenicol acetyltransferase [Candidatus Ozemobacteraceae bacterium]|nr:chloramphenicol acetyltransferase [Candidatus Ozemobacteraceae bacterium]